MFKLSSIFFYMYVSCLSFLCCLVYSLNYCDHLLGKGSPFGSCVYSFFLCFVTFSYGVTDQVWDFIYRFLTSAFLFSFLQNRN